MLGHLGQWLTKLFDSKTSAQSELEKYLSQQEIHSNVDLEHYMKLFDEKQRRLNNFWTSGNMTGYAFEKKFM